MNPVAVSSALVPFTNVTVILDPSPHTLTMFETLVPFSVVDLTIGPSVDTLTVCFTLLEHAKVGVSISVALEPFALSDVVYPLTLILATHRVAHDPIAMPLFGIIHLTKVD